MNCYVFIEIFEFFKRSVETLCNLHNSLDAFIFLLKEYLKSNLHAIASNTIKYDLSRPTL